jgi:hypothetical protein
VRPRLLKPLFLLAPIAALAFQFTNSYLLPVDHPAILYSTAPIDDAISRLQRRIDSRELKLPFDDQFGYLTAVLQALKVPVSSQLLVFSKTSFQAPRIGPRTPRALYFNDAVTVGFVRSGEVLEFAVSDPRQGTIFYTLDQERSTRPRFIRRDICLQCHQSPATEGVPGFVVRSVTPDWNGFPAMSLAATITDHRSPLKDRWGGWYVTGNSGDQSHMGNAALQHPDQNVLPISEATRNLTSLGEFIEPAAYLSPHSDIVALMTLEHETRMTNLMIRAGWNARIAVSEATKPGLDPMIEELLEYTLFSGEAKLINPVQGTSGFTEEFQNRSPRDANGRSLYQFDLQTRMFRYPCSYLIYSEMWDNLPAIVKDRIYLRMEQVLTGKDQSPKFAHLTPADKEAILEILLETKKGLPVHWNQLRKPSHH